MASELTPDAVRALVERLRKAEPSEYLTEEAAAAIEALQHRAEELAEWHANATQAVEAQHDRAEAAEAKLREIARLSDESVSEHNMPRVVLAKIHTLAKDAANG